MNKKQRNSNRKTYDKLMYKLQKNDPVKYTPVCRNCGEYGSHFIPPCFGEDGFYYCKQMLTIKELT